MKSIAVTIFLVKALGIAWLKVDNNQSSHTYLIQQSTDTVNWTNVEWFNNSSTTAWETVSVDYTQPQMFFKVTDIGTNGVPGL